MPFYKFKRRFVPFFTVKILALAHLSFSLIFSSSLLRLQKPLSTPLLPLQSSLISHCFTVFIGPVSSTHIWKRKEVVSSDMSSSDHIQAWCHTSPFPVMWYVEPRGRRLDGRNFLGRHLTGDVSRVCDVLSGRLGNTDLSACIYRCRNWGGHRATEYIYHYLKTDSWCTRCFEDVGY